MTVTLIALLIALGLACSGLVTRARRPSDWMALAAAGF